MADRASVTPRIPPSFFFPPFSFFSLFHFLFFFSIFFSPSPLPLFLLSSPGALGQLGLPPDVADAPRPGSQCAPLLPLLPMAHAPARAEPSAPPRPHCARTAPPDHGTAARTRAPTHAGPRRPSHRPGAAACPRCPPAAPALWPLSRSPPRRTRTRVRAARRPSAPPALFPVRPRARRWPPPRRARTRAHPALPTCAPRAARRCAALCSPLPLASRHQWPPSPLVPRSATPASGRDAINGRPQASPSRPPTSTAPPP